MPPPEPASARPARLVEHYFRHEAGRLHGALIRLLGVHELALAEDVAQEAMLRALRVWSMCGVPENPSAWITEVAMNLARDALRHRRVAAAKEPELALRETQRRAAPEESALQEAAASEMRDDAMRLLFLCAHPALPHDSQVVLALKVLGGFGTGEIARAFLASEAAIEKQLARAKQRLAEAHLAFEIPAGAALAERLDAVLATIYLVFNEGYKASSGDRLLREDLCDEALRLGTLLVAHPACDVPRSHALLALMLLTAARFPTRLDEHGALLRLGEQDRSR
jgi:RNA polymerase sigma-70 factor (ECF subfamily)